MQLVLAVYNSKYIHSSLAPWCLAAACEAAGQPAQVLEGTINQSPAALAQKIIEAKPDTAGFSVYIWNRRHTFEAVRLVRRALPGCVILLGGPEVSHNPAEVLAELPEADYILSGEGEESLPAFCRLLADGRPGAGSVPGLCGREDGRIYTAPPAITETLPPSPYTPAYLEALGGRIAYIETTRGCPYRCAFCLSGRCGPVRCWPLDEMFSRIALLANSGARTVKFVDRTFNANPARAAAIWRWIAENRGRLFPENVCFHFEIAGDILTEEHFELLARFPAGAVQLEIGLQSFHEPTLSAIHRKTDCTKLAENIRRLAAPGNLHLHIDLIAGLPLEDFSTFARSFNIAFSLRPSMLQLGFLKLLHGADMREDPSQFPCRYSPDPPYEVIDTPWISAAELSRIHAAEDALERLYNSGRFIQTVNYLLSVTKLDAFSLFLWLGEHIPTPAGTGLDAYTAALLHTVPQLPGADTKRLRDVLCLDRLATGDGRLPACLHRPDPQLAVYLRRLAQRCPAQGVRRTAAVLYGEKALAWSEHDRPPHPVTGRCPVHTIPLSALAEEGPNAIL